MPNASAVPASLVFSLVRGDAANWTLTVTFPASAVSVDLHDYEISMLCKVAFTDKDSRAIFTLTKGNGDITVDSMFNNIAHISMDGTATNVLDCPPPLYKNELVWDIRIEGPDGKPYTVSRGTLSVVADTTRDI